MPAAVGARTRWRDALETFDAAVARESVHGPLESWRDLLEVAGQAAGSADPAYRVSLAAAVDAVVDGILAPFE
jgi:hypothetical protein